ncbi:hypothetical protein DM02DRAFT_675910 [Periconia macrospinosa]|uniref:Uncharacterized protein n=1 Tax=Periconia macrospinosa TaxID=97972 RepID=A0A2V1D9P0_9PLEO|nr:hypothetical protein DM02DRAFT_675910 [Periconia macrospinosa]
MDILLKKKPEKAILKPKPKPKPKLLATLRNHRYASSVALVISSFIGGVLFAIAHHLYYSKLNDQVVGSPARQQWSIRFGSAFAFLTQVCLAHAAGAACIEWIWRRCFQQATQIAVVDAAFAVDRNIFTLLDMRFVSRFPVATALAIVFWFLPLSSIITPATLSVESKPNMTSLIMPVNVPNINTAWDGEYSTYSFLPTSGLERLVNLMARTGERVPVSSPGNLRNASYTTEMAIPIIRCYDSNDTVRSLTAKAVYKDLPGPPRIDWSPNNSTFHPENLTLEVTSKTTDEGVRIYPGYYATIDYPQNNAWLPPDLWIALAKPPEGPVAERMQYGVSYYRCSPRNATVAVDIAFVNNVPSIHTEVIQEKEYFDTRNDANNTIEQTVFGTAKDFANMTATWGAYATVDNSTIQEKNLTLLIEEFSMNASLSLMTQPSFSMKIPIQVNDTIWLNKYAYNPRNLFIAYGCSIVSTLIAVIAGIYAIYVNGESYDNRFLSHSKVMQSPDVVALLRSRTTDTPSTMDRIGKSKIRLHKSGDVVEFRIDKESTALIEGAG